MAEAERALGKRDPVMRELIRRTGPCTIGSRRTHDHFGSLVQAIVFQQLSGKVANVIYGRVVAAVKGQMTPGEVLKLSHWIAQLHLHVAEGTPPRLEHLDDAELHERMRKGLGMTAGRDLLLLCAWVYAQRGEHDDARFTWRQAMDREGSQRLEVAMPKLAEWMTAYRAEHPELDAPEPEEDL